MLRCVRVAVVVLSTGIGAAHVVFMAFLALAAPGIPFVDHLKGRGSVHPLIQRGARALVQYFRRRNPVADQLRRRLLSPAVVVII